MRIDELINEDSHAEELRLPLWFNLIKNGLSRKDPVNFYFASGNNRIVDIYQQKAAGKLTINLVLNHVKKMENGKPKMQMYTIWEEDRLTGAPGFNKWSLQKFKDGHALRMMAMIEKDKKKVAEGMEDPLVISMFKRLIDANQKVYFVDRRGRKKQVSLTKSGQAANPSGVDVGKVWYFYAPGATEESSSRYQPVFWRVGDNINKLRLKDHGEGEKKYWVIGESMTDELKTPLVVKLMNQRLENKGAVRVDIDSLPVGTRVVGWVTEPLEKQTALGGKPMYRMVVHVNQRRKLAVHLMDSADQDYTLKTTKDGNGNTSLMLVNRDDSQKV